MEGGRGTRGRIQLGRISGPSIRVSCCRARPGDPRPPPGSARWAAAPWGVPPGPQGNSRPKPGLVPAGHRPNPPSPWIVPGRRPPRGPGQPAKARLCPRLVEEIPVQGNAPTAQCPPGPQETEFRPRPRPRALGALCPRPAPPPPTNRARFGPGPGERNSFGRQAHGFSNSGPAMLRKRQFDQQGTGAEGLAQPRGPGLGGAGPKRGEGPRPRPDHGWDPVPYPANQRGPGPGRPPRRSIPPGRPGPQQGGGIFALIPPPGARCQG